MTHYELTPILRAYGFVSTGVSFIHYEHNIMLERVKSPYQYSRFCWWCWHGMTRLKPPGALDIRGRSGSHGTAESAAKAAFKRLKIPFPEGVERIWADHKNEVLRKLRQHHAKLNKKPGASSQPTSPKRSKG